MTLPPPYSHSGRIGRGVLLPIIGLLGAIVGAVPWIWANVQESVAGWLSVVLVAWLTAWATFPLAFGARVLGCRNRAFLQVASFGTAHVAMYAAWACFAGGLVGEGFGAAIRAAIDYASHPGILVLVPASVVDGWYEIAGVRPAGVFLGALWVMEVGIVVTVSVTFATRFIDGSAYCDACGAWCTPDRQLLVPVTAGKTMKGIRAEGLASLQTVIIPDGEVNRTLQIQTWTCPRCRRFTVFTANQLHTTKGRRSVASAIVEPVIPLSVLREEDAADIERIRALLKAARAEQFADVEIEPRPEKG